MRISRAVLAGLLAAGLAGCTTTGPGPAAGPAPGGTAGLATAPHSSTGAGAHSSTRAGTHSATGRRRPAGHVPRTRSSKPATAAGPDWSGEPRTRGGVRAAAARFYTVYAAGQFATSWDLLAPAAQRLVPRGLWIAVHDGCHSGNGAAPRIIKAVTVFGNAAIVTERPASGTQRRRAAEDVFNYAGGRWGYSPQDVSIYRRGSVSADVGAARAAGYCGRREVSPL